MKTIKIILAILMLGLMTLYADMPTYFDLRFSLENNAVSAVKNQQGGTCWTHAAMAVLESNLLMNGNWTLYETGEPNLAEYHLDWWNGFNLYHNADVLGAIEAGLEVHYGGDYRVAAAYLTRGEGAVRDLDGQQFETAPDQNYPTYHKYYPKEILWYTVGENLNNIETIKQQLIQHGAIGTAIYYHRDFLDDEFNFYQPPSDENLPNHAVTIVGWDDSRETQAASPGAWIVKNSWSSTWGEAGYFWISYYDKVAGNEPEMGAVSMIGTMPMTWDKIYSHDYHGWRDTATGIDGASNLFSVDEKQRLKAVSFYTTEENVDYTISIHHDGNVLYSYQETAAFCGFHTHEITENVELEDTTFSIELETSNDEYAFDRDSEVPVLLGSSQRVFVPSYAERNQSFYLQNNQWHDLQDATFIQYPESANFCLKAYAERVTIAPEPVQLILQETDEIDATEIRWEHPKSDALIAYKVYLNQDLKKEIIRPFLEQATVLNDLPYGVQTIRVDAVYNWNDDDLVESSSQQIVVPIAAPQNFAVQQISGTHALLTWTPQETGLGCKIYRNGIYIGQTYAANFIDPNLSFGTYDYAIKFVSDDLISPSSDTVSITISEVAVENINQMTKFLRLYPNPFQVGKRSVLSLAVSVQENGIFEFSLYDTKGRKIKNIKKPLAAGLQTVSFSFSKPTSTGIYFMRMKGKNYEAVKQVLIVK